MAADRSEIGGRIPRRVYMGLHWTAGKKRDVAALGSIDRRGLHLEITVIDMVCTGHGHQL